jgi:hypothetical protein
MGRSYPLGGYEANDITRGPSVPFPVSSLASKAVEQTDLTAGNDACTMGSEGKISNLGIAGFLEVLGKVTTVSSNTTSGNSQDVPDYGLVQLAKSGEVLRFLYDTGNAPARGEGVILSTSASRAGYVRKGVAKRTLDTVQSLSTFGQALSNNNYVIDLDTANTRCDVLFLGYGVQMS